MTVKMLMRDSGISMRVIESSGMDTRLYHDLGIYGEIAWCLIEEMAKKVDISQFNFDDYFPPEFVGNNVLTRTFYSIVPFASSIWRRCQAFEPMTLAMVSIALDRGRWNPEQPSK